MPVAVTHSYDNSAVALWQAITQPQHMRSWFFENIPDFKAEKGFETSFLVDAGERKFLHLWKLIEVLPGYKIVYEWRYGGYAGVAKVTFEINKAYEQTKLTVTHENIEGFPQEIPEFSQENCQQGWDYFIKERLVNYMEKLQQA